MNWHFIKQNYAKSRVKIEYFAALEQQIKVNNSWNIETADDTRGATVAKFRKAANLVHW